MKKLLLLLFLTPYIYAGSFDIGGKVEDKANQFTASLDNSWEVGKFERDVEFNYRYKDANDIRTKNSGLIAFKRRLTFQPKQYVFSLTRYDYNEFRDIKYRTQVGLGYGYKILRTERIKMSNEFSARNSVWFFYKVADKVNFTNKFLYEASDVPLLRNETALNFMLTDKLKLGISNIYTEDPHDDNVLSFNVGVLF